LISCSALEIDADLVDAPAHGHVHCRQRPRTDRTVGREAVPLLESLDRLFQRRVIQRRVGRGTRVGRCAICRHGQVARDLQALAQQRYARIAHARLQCRPGGDRRPAAGGLDRAIFAQALAAALVPDVRWTRAVEGLADLASGQPRRESLQSLVDGGRRPLREVPLRADLHRVHFAHVHVVQPEHEGIGREQLEVGAILQCQRRIHAHIKPVRLQRLVVVVVRIEPVMAQVVDRGHELVEPLRVLPRRLELPAFEESRDDLVEHDARATHVLLWLVAQVIDALADRFAE
jgi:hypothetical protein